MKKFTREMLIGEIASASEDAANVLLESGMHCLSCPHSRAESLEQACIVHGIDVEELLVKLNKLNIE